MIGCTPFYYTEFQTFTILIKLITWSKQKTEVLEKLPFTLSL